MTDSRQNKKMICTIPARGGSKRLRRKNVRDLAGKPMIAYSIGAALQSGLFEQVYVCTEDEEIARTATKFGATVPQLVPEELCGDLVASHIPCQYVERQLPSHGSIDSLLCLQPSSPLRSAQDIRDAVEKFSESDCDFVVDK